jgi:hypothetical protein
MKQIAVSILLIFALGLPTFLYAQTAVPTVDIQQQLQKLQEQINQLELKNEQTQSQLTQGGQKPAVSLTGGSLEQDFESNSDSWSILQGQTLHLDLAANPLPNAKGTFDLMFLGKVAPDILHYSYLPTFVNNNIYFILRKSEVDFDTSILSFRAFTGMPHDSFYNSDDDFYYLFPAQQDVDTPFRVSGQEVATGMEIQGKQELDGLDIWAGYELNWGVNQEVIAKYKKTIEGITVGVIDKVALQTISASSQGASIYTSSPLTITNYTNSATNETELFVKVPVPNAFVFDGVVLYNPISANMPYNYVTSVAPGTGTDGTNYQLYTGTTNNTTDALGYQVKITSNSLPVINSIMINGEYSGIIAGDLERITGEITEIPAPNWLITFDATAQQPLFGPNPLVYNGSPSSPLGAMVEPRGEFDPFRVTQDPISGINNRQMTKFSLSALFNTGNGWFFKYNPNVFDSYNVNMNLDTDFSMGVIGTVFNYPTGTDLTSVVQANGTIFWETPGDLGQPATDGYLPFVHLITMWKTDQLHWIVDLQGGYSMASLGQSSVIRSSTDLFEGTLTGWIHDTSLSFTYGQDVWGPETWDVQYGDTIGQIYVAQATQKFGLSTLSLKYERWSNLPGDPYQYPNINGVNLPIDELYATYTLNF